MTTPPEHQDAEQMLAMAAHDLRQPLRQLNLRLALLARKAGAELPAEIQAELAAAQAEGRRMQELLGEVLDWAAGGSAEEAGRVALDEVVAEARELLRARLAEAAMQLDCAAPLPVVTARRGAVLRILMNLLKNAADHGGSGVRVTLRPFSRDDYQGLIVEDDGPGIAEADRERIFTPFDRGRTSASHGHGLGLSICQRLATEQGGAFGLESSAAGGAAFYLLLPKVDS